MPEKICVYAHYYEDPRLDLGKPPYYIGTGTLQRAKTKASRSEQHLKIIAEWGLHFAILKTNLSKAQGLIQEEFLIKKYGRLCDGSGCLINIKETSIPKPFNGGGMMRTNIYLSEPNKDILAEIAKARGVPVAELVRQAIHEFIQRQAK